MRDPAALRTMLQHFESSFGDREVRRWFRGDVLGFRLHEGVTSVPDYHTEVARYFDRLAPQYDFAVASNALDRYLRSVSGRVLSRAFGRSNRVLEIGCGTGLETLPLARRGVRIVATDISGEMLGRLAEKVASEGLSGSVEMRRVSARDLRQILDEFGPESFDGVFSDFGALNCEPEWGTIPEILHKLLGPEGTLILGIWNRYCLAEGLLCLAARKPRRALARLQRPVGVGWSRYGVPVFARGPGETLARLRPHFRLLRLTGLPVFLPPYDFGSHLASRDALLSVLRSLDEGLADKFPFNRMGDHFLAEWRRR